MMQGYKEIELPALTFPATWLAATRGGLEIVPIDVDKDTWIAPGVSGFGVPSYAPVVDAAGAFGEQKVPLLKESMIAVFSGTPPRRSAAVRLAGSSVGPGRGRGAAQDDELPHRERGKHRFGTNAKLSEYGGHVAGLAGRLRPRGWLSAIRLVRQAPTGRRRGPEAATGAYSLMPVKLPCDAQPVLERMKLRRRRMPALVHAAARRPPAIHVAGDQPQGAPSEGISTPCR
jgi:hypothetical protein